MDLRPESVTADSLDFSGGADNVWSVSFAASEDCSFTKETSRRESPSGDRDDTVIQPPAAVQSSRLCIICAKPLVGRQALCCSFGCSTTYARRFPRYREQRGDRNPNWRGGASKRPIVYVRRFKAANPEKAAAHQVVASAIRRGHLTRPSVCSACLKTARIDAHHADYTKPLDVKWLCRRCHRTADILAAALRQGLLKANAPTPKQANRHTNVVRQPWKFRGTHARSLSGKCAKRNVTPVAVNSVAEESR